MNIISNFWLALLEAIYLPINSFFGYNSILAFVVLIFFVALQIWIFWHLFFKPYIYICKIFVNFIYKNYLWKEVEVDEKR
jgi:hypothetical protein